MDTAHDGKPGRIGIVSAMRREISLLLEKLEGAEERECAGRDYITGRLAGREAVLVSAGMGKVRAAMATQALIDLFHVHAIFCIGMAGGLEPSLKPGDVVIASEVVQHDYDLSGGSKLIGFFTDRVGATLVRCDESLAAEAQAAAAQAAAESCPGSLSPVGRTPRVLRGRVLSGDTPVFKRERKEALHSEFGGLCVEMEGAAVGQVCAANGVPFVVIRAVSDRAEGHVMLEFKKNLTRVAPIPQRIVLAMLRKE